MQGFMGYLILVIFASEWMKIAPPQIAFNASLPDPRLWFDVFCQFDLRPVW